MSLLEALCSRYGEFVEPGLGRLDVKNMDEFWKFYAMSGLFWAIRGLCVVNTGLAIHGH